MRSASQMFLPIESPAVVGCGAILDRHADWLSQKNRSLASWSSFPNPYDGYDYNWFLVNDIKRCIEENKLRYATFTGKGDVHSKKAYLIKKELLYKYKTL